MRDFPPSLLFGCFQRASGIVLVFTTAGASISTEIRPFDIHLFLVCDPSVVLADLTRKRGFLRHRAVPVAKIEETVYAEGEGEDEDAKIWQ